MNDISPYMIQHSVRFLHRRLIKSQLDKQIKIVADWSDFLQLGLMFKRPNCRGIVWAILGGTIGNVRELTFFQALNSVSRLSDLLIVGIDTIGNESAEGFAERMTTEYRSKELDALLPAPVQGIAAETDDDESIVNVTVHPYVDGDPHNRSDVPNSRTAVFSIPSPFGHVDETVLAQSTRYVLEDFVAYARQFGWEHLGTTPAPPESAFRQLLLRRAV